MYIASQFYLCVQCEAYWPIYIVSGAIKVYNCILVIQQRPSKPEGNRYNRAPRNTKGSSQHKGNQFNSAPHNTKGPSQKEGNRYNSAPHNTKGPSQHEGNRYNSAPQNIKDPSQHENNRYNSASHNTMTINTTAPVTTDTTAKQSN